MLAIAGRCARYRPQLVKDAQSKASGPDSSDAVKRILGAVSSVAIGVAELRNRGYGTGHGPAGPRIGLRPRHAYLAINAAVTWCPLMLETLDDPQAPWQNTRRNGRLGRLSP